MSRSSADFEAPWCACCPQVGKSFLKFIGLHEGEDGAPLEGPHMDAGAPLSPFSPGAPPGSSKSWELTVLAPAATSTGAGIGRARRRSLAQDLKFGGKSEHGEAGGG